MRSIFISEIQISFLSLVPRNQIRALPGQKTVSPLIKIVIHNQRIEQLQALKTVVKIPACQLLNPLQAVLHRIFVGKELIRRPLKIAVTAKIRPHGLYKLSPVFRIVF